LFGAILNYAKAFRAVPRCQNPVRKVRAEALDWLEEARADLRHASRAHRMGSSNWACFAAEQAADKALKAFLMGALKKRPIHVHDLTILHRQAQGRLRLPASIANRLAELSAYYTTARYPNAGLNRPSASITSTQAGNAIEIAGGMIATVERQIAKKS